MCVFVCVEPGEVDCGELGSPDDIPLPGHSNTNQGPGIGFGLGVAVVNDSTKTRRVSSDGE